MLSRRGSYLSSELKDGTVQGWSGTLDTSMHTMLTSYCIRREKDTGILPAAATGTNVALIDDAIICINPPITMSPKERDIMASEFISLVRNTYRALGFIVEASKTICSGRVTTFLNRAYASGAEIVVPAKTFSKIAAEHTLRLAG